MPFTIKLYVTRNLEQATVLRVKQAITDEAKERLGVHVGAWVWTLSLMQKVMKHTHAMAQEKGLRNRVVAWTPHATIELRKVRMIEAKGNCGNHLDGTPYGRYASHMRKNTAKDFWNKCRKDPESECWFWTGLVRADGYGEWKGTHVTHERSAHRIAWSIECGPIPPGMSVLHHCDTPLCCNPAHLFLGTQADNIADMHDKGRSFARFGENAGPAKLTEVQAQDILDSYVPRVITLQALAVRHGVNIKTVHDIVQRKTWGHLREKSDDPAPAVRKSRFLEGPDWIAFNSLVNDVLDEQHHNSDVWSTPDGSKGRMWIRKDGKRRVRWDYIEYDYGTHRQPVRLWVPGDGTTEYCDAQFDPEIGPDGASERVEIRDGSWRFAEARNG